MSKQKTLRSSNGNVAKDSKNTPEPMSVCVDYMLREQRDQEHTRRVIENISSVNNTNESVSIKSTFLHVNADMGNTGANEFARGHMTIMGIDSAVDVNVLSTNMCSQVMVFSVRRLDEDGNEVPIDVSEFESLDSKALDALSRAVPQQNSPLAAGNNVSREKGAKRAAAARKQGPSLQCMSSNNVIRDGAEWQSVLGKNGRVGLYRTEYANDEYQYVLVVHVDSTQASLDLYRWAYEQPKGSMLIGDFIKSRRYRYVCDVNKRNAQRIAAKAACALGLDIELTEDQAAYVEPGSHKVRPWLAVPSVHNEYNVFYSGKWNGSRVYMLYNNTVCTQRATGGIALMSDARSPVYVFPPTRNADSKSSTASHANAPSALLAALAKPVRDMQPGVTRTFKSGFSFPCTLGLVENLEQYLTSITSNGRAKHPYDALSKHTRQQIDKRITWEGKKSARDGKWFHHATDTSLYRQYSTKDDDVKTLLTNLYGEGDLSEVVAFKPVILKISSATYPGFDL